MKVEFSRVVPAIDVRVKGRRHGVCVLFFTCRPASSNSGRAAARGAVCPSSVAMAMELLQNETAGPVEFTPCSICGRTFNPEVLVSSC